MALTKTEIQGIVATYGKNANDTGSTEVQIALLTEQIKRLTAHLKAHDKDHVSRRSLLILVGQRRRLLDYYAKNYRDGYLALISKLGLRK